MLKIYYNNNNDYTNRNRFHDTLEKTDAKYNSFTSVSSFDLYYKVNNRLETINFRGGDFIPLGIQGMNLSPRSFTPQKIDNKSVTITYFDNNKLLEQPIITTN